MDATLSRPARPGRPTDRTHRGLHTLSVVAAGCRFGFAGWSVLIAAKARRQGAFDPGRPSKSSRRSGEKREGGPAPPPRRIRAAFSKRWLVLPRGGGARANTRHSCRTSTRGFSFYQVGGTGFVPRHWLGLVGRVAANQWIELRPEPPRPDKPVVCSEARSAVVMKWTRRCVDHGK